MNILGTSSFAVKMTKYILTKMRGDDKTPDTLFLLNLFYQLVYQK
jgi:hypothetical protein